MVTHELKAHPTQAEIAQLPTFPGLSLEQVEVLRDDGQCKAALAAIRKAGVIGFDTESKPTFTANAVRHGPHVIQFALPDQAYVVQINAQTPLTFLRKVLESDEIIKVGFGLKSDRELLHRKLDIQLAGALELTRALRQLGYRNDLGLKVAVAVVLGQQLRKPRSVTTSNWAAPALSPRQLLYAANDAYASLMVYLAMRSNPALADIEPSRAQAVPRISTHDNKR